MFRYLRRKFQNFKKNLRIRRRYKYAKNLAEEAISGVNSRLEQSKRAANPRLRTEMSHVAAGRAGEEFVLKELEKLGSFFI